MCRRKTSLTFSQSIHQITIHPEQENRLRQKRKVIGLRKRGVLGRSQNSRYVKQGDGVVYYVCPVEFEKSQIVTLYKRQTWFVVFKLKIRFATFPRRLKNLGRFKTKAG